MLIHLITAEAPASRRLRHRRLIQFPQLTMPLIAALTPCEHEVVHTDEIVEAIDFGRRADLVGITANTPSALHAYEVADEFRRCGVTVVMGGPHPTALPEEAAAHADAVVVGEAEGTWLRLLDDFSHGRLQPVYRASGHESLENLPAPRWDLIKGRRYGKAVTIATRGCPHRCDYCSVSLMYGTHMRFRPVDDVAREVAASPGKALVLWDDNIGADPAHAKELFRALTPLRRWWTSQCTLRAADDDEFLALAARSGCKALFVGLESISQPSLDASGKKHNTVEDYLRIIRRFHGHGIAVHAGVMFGFDEDDLGIFERTVDFLDRAHLDVATISMVVPMPGTSLFHRLEGEGRILTRDWSQYDGKKHCVFRPARMKAEQLVSGTEWAARRFYSWGSIARRLLGSRCGLWWNLPRNLGYKLALDQFGAVGRNPARDPVSPGTSPSLAGESVPRWRVADH